jgi:hypothetical protein
VIAVMVVAAIVAVSRTLGVMYEYRLLWIWPLSMLASVAIAWAAWNVVATRWPGSDRRILIPLVIAGLVVVAGFGVYDTVRSGRSPLYSTVTEDVANTVAATNPGRDGEVVLRAQSPDGEGYLQGLVDALERHGVEARVPSDPGEMFGAHRIAGHRRHVDLLVLTGTDLVAVPESERALVAYSGPVSLARQLELGARQARRLQRLRERLDAGEITAAEYARAVIANPLPGPTLAVFRDDRR